MQPDVLIVGGGLAGLSAAVELAGQNFSVVLLEQKQRCGGRVYSFRDETTGDDVDNGQHIMMGCYRSSFRYLHQIGSASLVRPQSSLHVVFREDGGKATPLSGLPLPQPLGALAGMLRLRTLTAAQRLGLLRVGLAILTADPEGDEKLGSLTVSQWLESLGQSQEVQRNLWNILAIGTLNDSPERASAGLFVRVLRSAFLGRKRNASLALPRAGLSHIFVDPAVAYLRSRGSEVKTQTSVASLEIENERLVSARLSTGEIVRPRAAVLAVPYYDLPGLLGGNGFISGIPTVDELVPSPIVTLHLWFDREFMKEEFAAFLASPLHWAFNKTRLYNSGKDRHSFISVVISGAESFREMPREEIIETALPELRRFYPESRDATLIHSLVIKEKRATFSPRVGTHRLRLPHRTQIRNLFLAGDWTDTKLPATIEGAVKSGQRCAALVREYARRE